MSQGAVFGRLHCRGATSLCSSPHRPSPIVAGKAVAQASSGDSLSRPTLRHVAHEAFRPATRLETFPRAPGVAIRPLVRRDREVKRFQKAFMNCIPKNNLRPSKKQASLARCRASEASHTQNCESRPQECAYCLGSLSEQKFIFRNDYKTDYTMLIRMLIVALFPHFYGQNSPS